jgi:WD40 repeat protein
MGIRSLDVSKDASTLASGCSDHSIRLWDYNSGIAQNILVGHQDVVTGTAFLNQDTLISTSWDMRIIIWKI